ncbi:MAG: MATE family efflux transporter, partial [Symbiobacteriaceae bacterium]|nr:MATE family efflux transporter [Symbiobacteriaceae bacterium]
AGAFRGTGQTLPPSLVSISCNSLRVLFAYLLAATSLGLNGVWWAVTICGSLRGFGIFIWYLLAQRKQPNRDLVAV